MINGRTVMVVMPAYRAGRTLLATWNAIPHDVVDHVLLVDDASDDDTVSTALELGIRVKLHTRNIGYGGNQKTCYRDALEQGADIIVMLHPDYQYEPRLISAMAGMISSGVYDMVLGSRVLGGGALKGGMPLWKYIANRCLTAFENILLGAKLSEYHTGYRAYSRQLLAEIDWENNSNDFQFDNELLAQVILGGYRLGEISVPTKYFKDASSINFIRSVRYGIAVLGVSVLGLAFRSGLYRHRLFCRVK
ncbi:glycosyltransferase family 2 protein [Azoarcus sp. L1K30]|uniref:glycosyltransferase family 2 protein n=1 Tax=Azoarcus sp. L1K30 TaxID=2820277 RepID=UPI001B81BD54|nr:glycosyltransferase family 2 protein [Azoarcus sp. L1K30]MBR0568239.1 glycosyltransferase family 2 protein [Azoarcus sp. L1K30]